MSRESFRVRLSEIDEERFGVRTARADGVSEEDLPSLLGFCREKGARFLIARCPVSDIHAAQAMEREGFRLMDTLVFYNFDLGKKAIPPDESGTLVRPIRAGEEETVRKTAVDSFKGYFGHYHADPRLDPAKCDEAYASWALLSCLPGDAAEEVLAAETEGRLTGFLTLRMLSQEEGEGPLFAVTPETQGRGVARALMLGGLRWCLSRGAARMSMSTQIVNIPVQKVWTRIGFELDRAYFTFHKWFD